MRRVHTCYEGKRKIIKITYGWNMSIQTTLILHGMYREQEHIKSHEYVNYSKEADLVT